MPRTKGRIADGNRGPLGAVTLPAQRRSAPSSVVARTACIAAAGLDPMTATNDVVTAVDDWASWICA